MPPARCKARVPYSAAARRRPAFRTRSRLDYSELSYTLLSGGQRSLRKAQMRDDRISCSRPPKSILNPYPLFIPTTLSAHHKRVATGRSDRDPVHHTHLATISVQFSWSRSILGPGRLSDPPIGIFSLRHQPRGTVSCDRRLL